MIKKFTVVETNVLEFSKESFEIKTQIKNSLENQVLPDKFKTVSNINQISFGHCLLFQL